MTETETEIPVIVREIQMNWGVVPEHHRNHPFMEMLRQLPHAWKLICHLSWSPVAEQIDPPEWAVGRLRGLPLSERERMLAFVEGTGEDPTFARALLGL